MTQRLIRRTQTQSRASVGDLLETLFVAELLVPGSRLLLISPWISDFPVIDNRAGQFTHLDSRWGVTEVRLSSVLRSLLARGTTVQVACQSGSREDEFVNLLKTGAETDGTDSFLEIRASKDVAVPGMEHEKALICDGWALYGSMNFTYSGVELNGELVTFTTDEETIAAMSAEFSTLFVAR